MEGRLSKTIKNDKGKTKENVLQLSSSLASLQSGTLSQRKCRPTHDPSSHWNSSERQSLVDEPAPPPADSSTGGADVGAASVGITFEGVVHSVTTRVTTSNFGLGFDFVLHIFLEQHKRQATQKKDETQDKRKDKNEAVRAYSTHQEAGEIK